MSLIENQPATFIGVRFYSKCRRTPSVPQEKNGLFYLCIGCYSLSCAEKVLCPHCLHILHDYINFVMKHQLGRGNMSHSYIDAKAKEVPSLFLQTARGGNEIRHDP